MNELNNLPPGFINAIMVIAAIVVLIGIGIYCLYVKNLRDTLLAVRPQNRQMPPAQVWLLCLSFINIFFAIPGAILQMGVQGSNPDKA